MKVCENCGARQSDVMIFCEQCKEKLGEPVSEEEKIMIEKLTEKNIKKLYKKSNSILSKIAAMSFSNPKTQIILSLISKIIFALSWIPYIFIIIVSLGSAFDGVVRFPGSPDNPMIYGIEAFSQVFIIMSVIFTVIPINPLCFIYQAVFLVKAWKKKKTKKEKKSYEYI